MTQIDVIKKEYFDTLSLDESINDYIGLHNMDNITDFQSLYEELEENGFFNQEVIYYASAMKILLENDPSLHESLEIAAEYGYEVQNLNSEILASLLVSEQLREQFNEFQSDIEDFFTRLDQIDEDEDLNDRTYIEFLLSGE